VPNAGDYEHFAPAAKRSFAAPETSSLPRPILGFAGNLLASRVDFDLLHVLADAHADATILLIGPTNETSRPSVERLAERPNVVWLGLKPYAELPRYVAAFDVGLIPYVPAVDMRSAFPIKLYEYMAAGKPSVATGVPEVAGMEPDVALAGDASEFLAAVERALAAASDADVARRMALAARNTWDLRTDRLLALVTEALYK
jgi:glycosyltransferase involved in cell wall biosynthesis